MLTISSVLVHPFGAIKAQRSNKPLLLDSTFDPQVVTTLEKSCRNYHSEKTEWPWYSYVAPISWMIENDVRRARSHMNLSHWNGYNPQEQQEILSENVRPREEPGDASSPISSAASRIKSCPMPRSRIYLSGRKPSASA